MPARLLTCHVCRRTLGTISRKHDDRGKPYDRIKLRAGVVMGHLLFRGDCAVCQCGEKTLLPESVTTVEFERRMK